MKVLVFIPGIQCTVYVQYLRLRQGCLSEEFGSFSSCKPKVCVIKSPLSNSRPSVHLCFIYDPHPLHLHMICCDDVSFTPLTVFVIAPHALLSVLLCFLSATDGETHKLNDHSSALLSP